MSHGDRWMHRGTDPGTRKAPGRSRGLRRTGGRRVSGRRPPWTCGDGQPTTGSVASPSWNAWSVAGPTASLGITTSTENVRSPADVVLPSTVVSFSTITMVAPAVAAVPLTVTVSPAVGLELLTANG